MSRREALYLLTSPFIARQYPTSDLPARIQEVVKSPEAQKPKDVYIAGTIASFFYGKIQITDISSGRFSEIPISREYKPLAITISPNLEQAAAAYNSATTEQSYLSIIKQMEQNPKLDKTIKINYFAPFGVVRWANDNKWLAAQFSSYHDARMVIFNTQTDTFIEYPDAGLLGFSPSGRWLAYLDFDRNSLFLTLTEIAQNQLGRKILIPVREFSEFDWAWANTTDMIAFQHKQNMFIFQPETNKLETFGTAAPFSFFGFSPDDRFLVYRVDNFAAKLAAVEVQTHKIIPFQQIEKFYSTNFAFPTNNKFLLATEIIETREIIVYIFDIPSGRLLERKVLKAATPHASIIHRYNSTYPVRSWPPYWIASYDWTGTLTGDEAEMYFSSVKDGYSFKLEGTKRKAQERHDIKLAIVTENELVRPTAEDNLFVVSEGKRIQITSSETAKILNQDPENATLIPKPLINKLPESEEKLSFVEGDIIIDSDGQNWLLRNGARYNIGDGKKFQELVKFNRAVHRVDNKWHVRIPIGKEPDRYGLGYIDWNGNFVEWQEEGGMLLIFISGYKSKTDAKTFNKIKEKLVANGWRWSQFIDATMNVTLDGNEIKADKYDERHSRDTNPEITAKRISLMMEKLKTLHPRSFFGVIAHSYGAFLGFRMAIDHPDAIMVVATLDGAIKGVDTALTDFGYKTDIRDYLAKLRIYAGDAVSEHLASLFDNKIYQERFKQKVAATRNRGVKFFTFYNINDRITTPSVAYLEESDNEFEGEPIKLEWDLGSTPATSFTDLVILHGQILNDDRVINELLKLFPAQKTPYTSPYKLIIQ